MKSNFLLLTDGFSFFAQAPVQSSVENRRLRQPAAVCSLMIASWWIGGASTCVFAHQVGLDDDMFEVWKEPTMDSGFRIRGLSRWCTLYSVAHRSLAKSWWNSSTLWPGRVGDDETPSSSISGGHLLIQSTNKQILRILSLDNFYQHLDKSIM